MWSNGRSWATTEVSLLPQAAKLYTTQLEWGLGHPAHTADARAALKRLVGGRITLQRGKTAGSLFAAYNFQRTALLAGVQVQRGSGGRFLKNNEGNNRAAARSQIARRRKLRPVSSVLCGCRSLRLELFGSGGRLWTYLLRLPR